MPGQSRLGAAAPELPGRDVFVLAYAGIIAAAGGSVTFNIWHASHRGHLQIALAFIFGVLPPYLATVLAHLAAVTRFGGWGQAWVFTITGAMMLVSAYATSQVVAPASGFPVGVTFSLATDAASMTCLYILMRAYNARVAYQQWLAAADPGTAAETGNHAGGAGSGNQRMDAAPGSVGMVPGTGDGNRDLAGLASAGRAEGSARQVRTPRAASARSAATVAGESREAVAAELAARPKPAVESTQQREQRALEIVAEFRDRTGQRMNNGELARALGMRKADVGGLREAIQDRERSAA